MRREFTINGNHYEIFNVSNGVKIQVNGYDEEYLIDTYEHALEFTLLLVECADETEKAMLEETYFHEQYELEGLTEDEDIEDYDDCDYEIGFNPYMGCYDYDC